MWQCQCSSTEPVLSAHCCMTAWTPYSHPKRRPNTFYLHCLQSDWTSPGNTGLPTQQSWGEFKCPLCSLFWGSVISTGCAISSLLTMNPKGHPICRATICQKANWPSSSLLWGCWQTGPQAFPDWSSHQWRCHSGPSSVAAGTSDWVAEIKDYQAHSGYILFGTQWNTARRDSKHK